MPDTFHINNVDKMINMLPEIEMSDISKIIVRMIEIKNDVNRKKSIKKKPYSIDDKISLNCLSNNLRYKVLNAHIGSYDIVDDAVTCIGEMESSIRSDLYDYYWETYVDVLSEMRIDFDDQEAIKSQSDKIYMRLIEIIENQIFEGKQTGIETNKKVTYLNAITAYTFYKCKFLIPVTDEID